MNVYMNEISIRYLAKCVYYHRKKSSLSQVALAKMAGVGKTVIYDIEHGKMSIQLDTLLKILHVLNINMNLESKLMDDFERDYNETS